MTRIFLTAIALVLVFEGILPFLSPQTWRQWMMSMASRDDRTIRIVGLVSMLLGALIAYLVHFNFL